jgi:hypothetical protein
MVKEIKYKAGSKNRHESLYKFVISAECSSNKARTIEEAIIELLEKLKIILDEHKVPSYEHVHKRIGLPEYLNIYDENNALYFKPIAIIASQMYCHLYQSLDAYLGIDRRSEKGKETDLKYILQCLIKTVENAVILTELENESAILGDVARSKPIKGEAAKKTKEKENWLDLCRPEYYKIKKSMPNASNLALSEELHDWLTKQYGDQARSQRTIRRWIDENQF